MAGRPYRTGRAFEYRVRDYFRRKGYFVVRQAKSAFPDLVVLGGGKSLLCECKVGGRLTGGEKEKAFQLMEKTGLGFYVAHRVRRRLMFYRLRKSGKTSVLEPAQV